MVREQQQHPAAPMVGATVVGCPMAMTSRAEGSIVQVRLFLGVTTVVNLAL